MNIFIPSSCSFPNILGCGHILHGILSGGWPSIHSINIVHQVLKHWGHSSFFNGRESMLTWGFHLNGMRKGINLTEKMQMVNAVGRSKARKRDREQGRRAAGGCGLNRWSWETLLRGGIATQRVKDDFGLRLSPQHSLLFSCCCLGLCESKAR